MHLKSYSPILRDKYRNLIWVHCFSFVVGNRGKRVFFSFFRTANLLNEFINMFELFSYVFHYRFYTYSKQGTVTSESFVLFQYMYRAYSLLTCVCTITNKHTTNTITVYITTVCVIYMFRHFSVTIRHISLYIKPVCLCNLHLCTCFDTFLSPSDGLQPIP
jgi:hypothetical protein